MRYANIYYNDTAAAPGIAVSVYLQGCPHHCDGCFNPETWSFEGGQEFSYDTLKSIINGLTANGIERSLCILGGEPLCPENQFLTDLIITEVKKELPQTKIYIWTGYVYEDLIKCHSSELLKSILSNTYCIIDGPFIKEERDITLQMRGSKNQRIIYLVDNNK